MRSPGSDRSVTETFSTGRTAALPFLPTLLSAAVIAGLSFLCQEPSREAGMRERPQVSPAPSMTLTEPATTGALAEVPVPAATAFARAFPDPSPSLAATADEAAARPAPVRTATRRTRRNTTLARGAAPKPAAEPAAEQRSLANSEPGPDLPTGALPFAPTASAVWSAARSLGTGAVNLGSAVVDLVPSLR
ncbi:hypothetical protein [Methylobacterium organophilum]|uniref:Uncharacterized protein n=1 Tax=Methylobacterium organophilum TaxID=410 RepID=A0ABQ4TCY4_METOR|nr:hypothetical protein [Methylobacterium organophilum]GJE28919.1 hypothetical protein LKMONMHP_3794 [Methylobacterium organophilum]